MVNIFVLPDPLIWITTPRKLCKRSLLPLDDLVRYGDRVTCLERGHFGLVLGPHLLVHEPDDSIFVHLDDNFDDSAPDISAVPDYHTPHWT